MYHSLNCEAIPQFISDPHKHYPPAGMIRRYHQGCLSAGSFNAAKKKLPASAIYHG